MPTSPPVIPLADVPWGVHPGQVVRKYLSLRKITQKIAADRMGMSRSNLNLIVAGRRRITNDTAERLDSLFGTDDDYWITIQAHHDRYRAAARRRRKDQA